MRVKWHIGRPQEALLCAKAKRQQQMFYLCESEATATNVLSVRKRSDSNKCFICAKAKRQRQMFYLRESEASATNVLSARKRSVSNKCFICAKAKRQQQSAQPLRKSTTRYGDETDN
ncbi:hypothetical protein [Lysinibacillus xylanilyticus]|uniref:hypothetical protein n=1 Tax=Lysinibacillus xylanilyticus TaxID=582475 RepID=UPI003D03F47F